MLNRYGLPFVSPNNILVSTINGTGAGIELIYVFMFIIFAPRREKAKILGLLTFVLTVFSTVALVSLLALQDKTRKLFCGFAASIFSIIMYGSPLSIMVSLSYFLPFYFLVNSLMKELIGPWLNLFQRLCHTHWTQVQYAICTYLVIVWYLGHQGSVTVGFPIKKSLATKHISQFFLQLLTWRVVIGNTKIFIQSRQFQHTFFG